jgi:Zn-dependent M28 family amino/carboxypeptidase
VLVEGVVLPQGPSYNQAMRIIHSHEAEALSVSPKIKACLDTVSEDELRELVEAIARPRHFVAESRQNRSTAEWLAEKLASFGLRVEQQGSCSNIVAVPRGLTNTNELILVGAHYDSVPESPGADDNGSAVAAMVACAAACGRRDAALNVLFVAFNREEEGFLGSRDFVESYLPDAPLRIRHAHILEMVGYASSEPGSQRLPTGLPIQLSNIGNFLGLLANSQSAPLMERILAHAAGSVVDLPVTALQVVPGAERLFPVRARSDHVPFWSRDIPAVMWTDTAEFRNPNYHQPTDTPNTLNYTFLKRVTQLLTASVLADV